MQKGVFFKVAGVENNNKLKGLILKIPLTRVLIPPPAPLNFF